MSATVCINDGNRHNAPIEAGEAKAPIIVREHLLRPDLGGPGQFRRGRGIRRVVEANAPITVNSQIERTQCAPWGLNSGLEGLANQIHVSNGKNSADGIAGSFEADHQARPSRSDRDR